MKMFNHIDETINSFFNRKTKELVLFESERTNKFKKKKKFKKEIENLRANFRKDL